LLTTAAKDNEGKYAHLFLGEKNLKSHHVLRKQQKDISVKEVHN